MGTELKRIKSFGEWTSKKILVIHMETKNLDVESCLKASKIPFFAVGYKHKDFEGQIREAIPHVIGLIITGSHKSGEDFPDPPKLLIELGLPVLGLCYGNEWIARKLGGKIIECNPPLGEFSEVEVKLEKSLLFQGIDTSDKTIVTMAHKFMLNDLPKDSKLIASTGLTPIAGFENLKKGIFGLQFHPEKGFLGEIVFSNFYKFCLQQDN